MVTWWEQRLWGQTSPGLHIIPAPAGRMRKSLSMLLEPLWWSQGAGEMTDSVQVRPVPRCMLSPECESWEAETSGNGHAGRQKIREPHLLSPLLLTSSLWADCHLISHHDGASFPDSLAPCLILFLSPYSVHSTRLWWPASRVTPPVPLSRVVLSTAKENGAGLCTQEVLQPCGVTSGLWGSAFSDLSVLGDPAGPLLVEPQESQDVTSSTSHPLSKSQRPGQALGSRDADSASRRAPHTGKEGGDHELLGCKPSRVQTRGPNSVWPSFMQNTLTPSQGQ